VLRFETLSRTWEEDLGEFSKARGSYLGRVVVVRYLCITDNFWQIMSRLYIVFWGEVNSVKRLGADNGRGCCRRTGHFDKRTGFGNCKAGDGDRLSLLPAFPNWRNSFNHL